jgi:hypothetical protein
VSSVLATASAVGMAALHAYAALAAGRWLLPDAPTSVRLCASGVISLWLLLATFQGLAWAGLFTPTAALLTLAATAACSHVLFDGSGVPAALRRDLGVAAARARSALRSPERAFYLVAALLLAFVVVRALLTPPLTHDSLTYHFFLAAGWVQQGGMFSLAAPDAWSYYRYFPANGEVLTAWLMLPFHGDLAANLACLLPWLLSLLAFYGIARFFEVERRWAALGALLLGFTPAVFAYLPSGYVEIPLLAGLLCGTLFSCRAVRSGAGADIVLACLGFGCALGTKLTAAPVVAFGVLLPLCGGRPLAPKLRWLALGASLAAVVSLPWYLRAWIEQGSPFYPFALRLPGWGELPGAPALQETMLTMRARESASLLHMAWQSVKPLVPHPYTLGPLFVVALAVTPLAARRCIERKQGLAALSLVLGAAGTLAGYFSSETAGIRLYWPAISARFLTYVLAVGLVGTVIVIDTAGPRARALRNVLLALLALHFALVLPRGYALETGLVIVAGLLLAVVAASGIWLATSRLRLEARSSALLGAGIAALALACVPPVLDQVRGRFRHAFLAEAYELRDFPHELAGLWALSDRPDQPLRIAFAAGWDGIGHNWLWYPLLGRNLQNQVTYVPITASGAVIDYRDTTALEQQASFSSWLRSLVGREIDWVVVPSTQFEGRWTRTHPEVFQPLAVAPEIAFSLNRGRARALLEGPELQRNEASIAGIGAGEQK